MAVFFHIPTRQDSWAHPPFAEGGPSGGGGFPAAQPRARQPRPAHAAARQRKQRAGPSHLIPNQEVQHVPAVGTLGFIELGIAAVGTAHRDELLVLHVEELGKIAARGLKLVAFILRASALRAHILHLFHGISHPFPHIILEIPFRKKGVFLTGILRLPALLRQNTQHRESFFINLHERKKTGIAILLFSKKIQGVFIDFSILFSYDRHKETGP